MYCSVVCFHTAGFTTLPLPLSVYMYLCTFSTDIVFCHVRKSFYAGAVLRELLARIIKNTHTHKHTSHLKRYVRYTVKRTHAQCHTVCLFSTFCLFSPSVLVLWCLFNTNTQTDADLCFVQLP